MKRVAIISDCGNYRYVLRRTWDHKKKPRALFIMLNPSTADAIKDDATIRSCIRLSKAYGYGGFEVVNLFAWRATNPNEVLHVKDPIGPQNDHFIRTAMERCDLAICAWGAHQSAIKRANVTLNIIRISCTAIFCLGKTKAGFPKHPLYIKTGTPLEVFA